MDLGRSATWQLWQKAKAAHGECAAGMGFRAHRVELARG